MRISLFLLLGISLMFLGGCASRRHGQIASKFEGVKPRVYAALKRMGIDREQRCNCETNQWSDQLVENSEATDSSASDIVPSTVGIDENALKEDEGSLFERQAQLSEEPLSNSNPRLASNIVGDEKDLIQPVDDNFWNETPDHSDPEMSPTIVAEEGIPTPSLASPIDELPLVQPEPITMGSEVQLGFLDGRSTMIRLKATTPIDEAPRRASVASINFDNPRFVGGASHLLTQPKLERQPEIDYQMRPTIDHQRLQESLRRLTIRPTEEKNR